MNMSRRKSLALLGGGTILAAGAAAGGFAATRTPHAAMAPWSRAGTYHDPRKWALSYAILAPNPHNRQPWLVGLDGERTVTLWRDRVRDLPQTDPFQRQLTIGLGCFLEQMRIAASRKGVGVRLDLYPQGEEGPVAVATFEGSADPDPLFDAIPIRRSCKKPFSDRPVTPETAARLGDHATILTEPGMVEALRKLTWQAWLVEALTPRTLKESVDLMRFGKAEINADPDGIRLGGPFLESLMLVGLLTRKSQADTSSTGFRRGVALYREMLAATPAYAVLTSPTNTRADQIAAGRDWVRLNLAVNLAGLSLHPVSQALQEYPEMSGQYARAHALLAGDGGTVQMLGRLGYGPATPRSPRWPLETRLI